MKNPKLTLPYKEVNEILQKRIEEGYAILKKEINNRSALEIVQKRYETWHSFNSTLLNKIFSDSSISERYSFPGIIQILETSFQEEVSDFKNEIKSKIDFLEQQKNKLELYDYTKLTKNIVKGTGKTFYDRFINKIKNHKIFAIILFLCVLVIGGASLIKSTQEIKDFFINFFSTDSLSQDGESNKTE